MVDVSRLAEKPLAFPFYAAVVLSAWIGAGPGLLAVILSALAVEYFWAEPRFSLLVGADDLPWFLSFVFCSVMAFAWSWQRGRTQNTLESTVHQRTADLLNANAALQIEIAERQAAEEERREAEQALRDTEAELARTLRLATVAEIAATIAHEVNQPLAAITANASACLRSLSRDPAMIEDAREAASCIVEDGHRAADVITRIRALFNKEQLKQSLVDVNKIIERVMALSRGVLDRQQIITRLELSARPALVIGDPVQLQQVLSNLTTNAIEAMEAITDRPRRLTIRSAIEGDDSVLVSVADTGTGLDPDKVSHIFDSFYTTKPDGIGVGLAISRSIVEAHGGGLWASPVEPFGARFGFTLPLAAEHGKPSTPKSDRSAPNR
jgi:C4-dicarboxylate-specific signal transduction histidine kinase